MNGPLSPLPPSSKRKKDPKAIGPWKLGRILGEGSTCNVRYARHSSTGKKAAVKIMSKPGGTAAPAFASRTSGLNAQALDAEAAASQRNVEREIVIMKLIDHPNVMRLYDVWETPSRLFLILEYIEGGELFELLVKETRLEAPHALKIFQQIIGAIGYCHRFNVAHRDLKPENVLLDAAGNVKLADFGFASWQAVADDLLETSCGSPHYAAPEVISGYPYHGPAYDVWSCGVILYAMLVGRLPFDHDKWDVLSDMILSKDFSIPDDLDPQAAHLIRRMLDKNVDTRITVPEITQHPFFLSHPPPEPASPIPEVMAYPSKALRRKEVDPDIVKNLCALWRVTDEEEITARLTTEGECWEKRLYYLLCQYRKRILQNADEEAETGLSRTREKERRKAQKQKSGDPGATSTSTTTTAQSRNVEGVSVSPAPSRQHYSSSYSIIERPKAPTPRTASVAPRSSPVDSPDSPSSTTATTASTASTPTTSPRPPPVSTTTTTGRSPCALSTSSPELDTDTTTATATDLLSPTSPIWHALGLAPLNMEGLIAGAGGGGGGMDSERAAHVYTFLRQVNEHVALLRGPAALLKARLGSGLALGSASSPAPSGSEWEEAVRGGRAGDDNDDDDDDDGEGRGRMTESLSDDLNSLIEELSVLDDNDNDNDADTPYGTPRSGRLATPRGSQLFELGLDVGASTTSTSTRSSVSTPPLYVRKREEKENRAPAPAPRGGREMRRGAAKLKSGGGGKIFGERSTQNQNRSRSRALFEPDSSDGTLRKAFRATTRNPGNAGNAGTAAGEGGGGKARGRKVHVVEPIFPVGYRRKGRKSDESTGTTGTYSSSTSPSSTTTTATTTRRASLLSSLSSGSSSRASSSPASTSRRSWLPSIFPRGRNATSLSITGSSVGRTGNGGVRSGQTTAHLLSTLPAPHAVGECTRLLRALGVSVAESHCTTEGALSCSLPALPAGSSAGMMGAVVKGVQFRVEVRAAAAGVKAAVKEEEEEGEEGEEGGTPRGGVVLVFVLEKGKVGTFKLVVERMRREWEGDEGLRCPAAAALRSVGSGSMEVAGAGRGRFVEMLMQ